ncbi:BQ2448_8109 [Microbotryum intermedium]|uniref:BQ2448_8109 protein n=1 Tax=Microbotryum intermedium TaxID=269621 RepID=A0A238FL05_9BASI|nr:BQ2448_8109 [Microbotryum intermedium]
MGSTHAKPQDARDLLAMLGHSAKPPTATKPFGVDYQPKSRSVIPSTTPASSTVPSPAVAPATAIHASIPVPSRSPSVQAAVLPNSAAPAPEASSTLPNPANKSIFSAPLLSHDVFVNLPPIGSRPKKTVDNPTATTDLIGVAPVRATVPRTASPAGKPAQTRASDGRLVDAMNSPLSISRTSESRPRPSGSAQPRAKVASPAVDPSSLNAKLIASPPRVNRAEALEIVDAAASKAQIGLGAHEKEPLDQKQFIKALNELIQRPAFATSLYARYLERFEDDHATV